ncbi:MAG: sugar ABC transporter permease [Anaerolineae bacterium SG8_19]|jgi:ABC-type glycerol-3-phosphate transport system permease component|nr:MAG: sugar ABC transporter permease [Anaerolineae bacterium SG8_19]
MIGRRSPTWQKVLVYAFLGLYLLFVLIPILWIIQGSLKTTSQALKLPPDIIFLPSFDAYRRILIGGQGQLGGAFLNSFRIAMVNVILALILGVPAAYALARWRSFASEQAAFWILSVRMAPAFGIIVPIYILMRFARLIDTFWAVTLVHLTINLPLAIWLLRGYFIELPEELEESAQLDGASTLQVLWHIILPMSRPMLFAVSALVFMLSWNEFLFAFVLTSEQAVTVPVVITAIAGTMRFDWPLMSALASMSLIPAFLLVAYIQRHIVRGLTMGAVK